MVKRSKGTSSKGTKATKMKKKITMNEFVKPFKEGEKVAITIKPYFRGLPHSRYNGRSGIVMKKQGNAYLVKVVDGNAKKLLTVSPVHITRL
ncbi:50S ribosomal protein L21e [Candidatus Micrarchaeota archaeon]|nr:50S ribosomal protein L21e [Candidatus Micrarchaeota archaeon]